MNKLYARWWGELLMGGLGMNGCGENIKSGRMERKDSYIILESA